MNIPTLFLVVMTVFSALLPESSTAAVDSITKGVSQWNEVLDNAFKDAKNALDSDENLLAEVKKALETPLSQLGTLMKRFTDRITGVGPTVSVPDSVKEKVYAYLRGSEAALARAEITIADGLRTASDPQAKVSLIIVSVFLKAFKVIVYRVHADIENSITTGSVAEIKKSTTEIAVAVPLTKVAVAGFNTILRDDQVKAEFNKEMDTIIDNATNVGKLLNSLLIKLQVLQITL